MVKPQLMAGVDFISNLHDSLLIAIISLLPSTEAARTSVLSKRWKTMWKDCPHISLDQRQMLKHLIENYLQYTNPRKCLCRALSRKNPRLTKEEDMDAIAEAAMLINLAVDAYFGLKSCRIRHLPESCICGEVEGWMRKLLEKGVRKISMEREPDFVISQQQLSEFEIYIRGTIDLPFDIFSGFEVLELKNYYLKTSPSRNPPQILKALTLSDVNVSPDYFQKIISHCLSLENLTLEKCHVENVMIKSPSLKFLKICDMFLSELVVFAVNIEVIEIDTIFCNAKKQVFKTPKLQVLCSSYYMKKEEIHFSPIRDHLLTAKEILEISSGNLIPQGSKIHSVFGNLATLKIDLDLKNIKNATVLLSALKTCYKLKNLEINSQVDDDYGEVYNQNEDDRLPFHKHFFWQREFSQGICHNLKTLSIKGFMGRDFEVEFVKYIITNVETMEKITIWCVDGSTWAEATTTLCLLTFPKASAKLSITLKPGVEYMTKFGKSFEKWVSTLKD